MAGKLITLPFRVWFGSARLLTRAAGGVAGRAASVAGQTLGLTSSDHRTDGRSSDGPSPARAQTSSAGADPGWREESITEPVSPIEVEHPRDETESRPVARRPRDVPPVHPVTAVRPLNDEPEAPTVQEPVHVSEEPELVREEAEAGAEDGAGAQLRVMEPWNGYARMSARDVIARAQQATAAELAAVRLYEARHRSRQTVLAAVDRQLKLVAGPNPA
jgi:hypothetical protein